jgi:hypothetical protein
MIAARRKTPAVGRASRIAAGMAAIGMVDARARTMTRPMPQTTFAATSRIELK